MEDHQARVQSVQSQVAGFYVRKQRVRIYHGESNSTRLPQLEPGKFVDTRRLNHVIEINKKEQYILVEPSVTMDQLVDATLPHGLVPPVVMEFPGISVGGGIQGGAAESSSFRWGGFHETALEYEMVLGDGTVVTASRIENADLFWGTACTYGSLGVLTLVKLRLIPASRYVKLTYHRTGGHKEALKLIEAASDDKAIDFIDGILYSKTSGVIMTGVFADKPTGKIVTFSRAADEWFYIHARNVIRKHEKHEEYIPIRDYLFRYDRGAFWMGERAIKFIKLPFTKLVRRLLDDYMHTRFLYKGVHNTDLSQRYIVQDIFMPANHMSKFLKYLDHKLGIYPLWLLPMRPVKEKLDVFGLNFSDAPLIMNVGVWGSAHTKGFEQFAALNREIEDTVVEMQGRKTLYAHSYYPEEKFWQIYDREHYEDLRRKYKAGVIFDDMYKKVTVTAAYKAPVARAVWRYTRKRLLKIVKPSR